MSGVSDSEMRMLDLQYQMKRNNEDLQSYLSELDSWESDIKQKEDQLSKQKKSQDDVLPPVRNSLEKKKKKKVKKETESGKKTKRISSYDYRAWDKFDVDAACDSKSSSGSEYETDEEWEDERRKQAAVLEKDKGNDYFKKGDYMNAIECYTKGSELDPTNPLLPANRAMAFLKQEKFAAAELDCSIALSLDPLYTKAYLRRGSARLGLGKHAEAKSDYERVLQLEPQNKKAKADLEITEKELSKENMVIQVEPTTGKEVGIVKPITKAPHQRSTKFLRRIHIEEVGLEDDSERRAAVSRVESSQSQAKKEIVDKDGEMFARFTATSPGDIAKAASRATPSSFGGLSEQRAGKSSESVVTSADDKTICDSKSLIQEADNLNLGETCTSDKNNSGVETSAPHTDVPSIPKIESPRQTSTRSKSSAGSLSPRQASTGSGSGSPGSLSPREMAVPSSSVQFQSDFRLLKNNPEEFYKYFKRIEPSQYPKLFGQFLDAEVLQKILVTIKECYIKDGAEYFCSLKALTEVKRFSMVAMFFSRKEKQVVLDIFTHLRSTGTYSEDDIKALASKYDIR